MARQNNPSVFIPGIYVGLRAALGESVPSEHPIAKLLSRKEPNSKGALEWFDVRYCSVFFTNRITWLGNRRQRTITKLHDPKEFLSTDAEIQTAANILRDPNAIIEAQAEQSIRTADFHLLDQRTTIEVEVRAVMGAAKDVEEKRIVASLLKRLNNAVHGKPLKAILRVRKIRTVCGGPLLLDGRAEKRLVDFVWKTIGDGIAGQDGIYVSMPSDGQPRVYDRRTSLRGELASVEIRPSQFSGFSISFGGLRKSPGYDEIRNAIRRKSKRRQWSGSNPWVLVLDVTSDPMFAWEEMEHGVEASLSSSRSISAVVLQHRQVVTMGLGVNRKDPWLAFIKATVLVNSNATYPIPQGIADLFSVSKSSLLSKQLDARDE
jgi:hypothetical protein